MSYQTIVDSGTLAAHLSDPTWRIVDCRFDLGDPAAGAAGFAREHIPGAVYAHLDRDLSGPRTPWSGRHPLPDPQVLASTLGQLGIGAEPRSSPTTSRPARMRRACGGCCAGSVTRTWRCSTADSPRGAPSIGRCRRPQRRWRRAQLVVALEPGPGTD